MIPTSWARSANWRTDEHSRPSRVIHVPEDVIVYKLKYYLEGRKPKHLRDIAVILVVQGDALDHPYIAEWAEQIGAADLWAGILAEYRK